RHIFYALGTRETLREFDMAAAVTEVGVTGSRLKAVRQVDIELPKMDFAARPASRGEYHESILFFERK
ncbi:MAG TPA: hypothetical protein VLV78_06545, partial [Thermoanaerobaculia bacterium]|nr:hypothetical protein [Thermoanaerobaculia bacterium]